MKKIFTKKIKIFFTAFGRFFSCVRDFSRGIVMKNHHLAHFVYVTFPAKRKQVSAFLKKYRYKITIPAALCVLLAAVLLIANTKDTENSDYYTTGDEDIVFGMVLQHYSTFDHSEETHIAVALSWTNGAVSLKDGKASSRIKAKVYPVNLENPEIVWSSSDESIATVDKDGKIEASAPGRVFITAELKNYEISSKAKLSVRQPVTSIILPTSTLTLYTDGGARYLNARIFPENATNKNVTWHSKNNKIATVDSYGTVKPVGVGMTEITAVTEDGEFEGKCFVTVVNPSVDVESIELQNESDMSIRVGDNINAIMTVSPSNARNKTLTWSSDNEEIAVVSQTGRIRGVSEGTAYITAASVNGIKQTFAVDVGVNEDKDPFELGTDTDYGVYGTVAYTPYDVTFPQAVRAQMAQSPALKIWTAGGTVTASEAEVAEYMNPNNYFEDYYKYQFLDLAHTNNVSEEALNLYLADKGILRGTGAAFIRAAREYDISEIYLVAHACLETGNGTSQLSTGVSVNGETVYNVFGIGAYDSSALSSGSQRAYSEGWTSVEAAITGGAEWIDEHYINSGDTRQNTLYKMLWNPENPAYHQYATDVGWAVKQALTIGKILEYCPTASLSYDVPVYSGQIPPTISAY